MTRGERNIAWIESVCRIPEGKFVGQPVRLRDWQKKIILGIYDSPTRRAIISFGRKNAKALALDTPIPTPSGWRAIADIEPGDEVFGADGAPCRVLAVSGVFQNKPCYRVGFSDGSVIVVSEDHLWTTRHSYRPWAEARINGSGNGGRWRTDTVTTAQIAESVLRRRKDNGREYNHKIAVAGGLKTKSIDLPISPYVLGAWLGDGTTSCAAITVGAQDVEAICAELLREGIPVRVRENKGRAKTLILSDGDRSYSARNRSVHARLRQLRVLGNKHIPEAYLSAGTEQRWALLQGLMDTDGTVNRCGGKTTARCSFSNTNGRLAYDTWRLARSLGLKASIAEGDAVLNGRIIGHVWRVEFAAHAAEQVFRLERKQRLLPDTLNSRSRTLAITSCEEVSSVPTKCLMVDAPDSLFLVGHGCIPTHNTTKSAFLLLLHLCGPEARPNSQLFSAAQSRDQAAILFALASKIVRMSPDLSRYVVVRDTAKQLLCPELGTLYRALSADAATAYGLSPVFTVHDELGQVKGPRSELYEALETASGAQESPLSIVISTQAPTDADLLSLLIDDAKTGADPRLKLFLYSAPETLDPFSEEAWRAANPAYGDFLNAEEVQEQAAAANRMPSRESSYRNLILNQRVSLVSPFIPRRPWEDCSGQPDLDAFGVGPVFIGLDLSARNDLTALSMVARSHDGIWNVRTEFFAPLQGLTDRATRDRAPYDVWARNGVLTTTPGSSVDYEWVALRLCSLCDDYDVAAIAFDRWRIDVLVKELMRLDRELPLEPFGQGFKDMSPALDVLESEILQGRLRHGGNPLLNWCAANAIAVQDPAGNRKLDKSKTTGRIDGIIALAMAMGVASAKEHAGPSVYESRGILVL